MKRSEIARLPAQRLAIKRLGVLQTPLPMQPHRFINRLRHDASPCRSGVWQAGFSRSRRHRNCGFSPPARQHALARASPGRRTLHPGRGFHTFRCTGRIRGARGRNDNGWHEPVHHGLRRSAAARQELWRAHGGRRAGRLPSGPCAHQRGFRYARKRHQHRSQAAPPRHRARLSRARPLRLRPRPSQLQPGHGAHRRADGSDRPRGGTGGVRGDLARRHPHHAARIGATFGDRRRRFSTISAR